MELSQKPFLSAALTGAGGAATLFALHQSAEVTLLSTAAGMALMAAASFVPESFRLSEHEVPQLRVVGWQPTILSPDRAQMLRKLEVDFADSPLPGKADVLGDIGDIYSKALRFGRDRAERLNHGIALLEKEYDPPTDISWVGMPKAERLEPLLELSKPLSVSCSVIEPAVLAALLDMKLRLGIPINVEYTDINGRAQVNTAIDRLEAGRAFDVIIVANAPFLCSDEGCAGTAIRNLYEFVLPVHREHQHVLRTKLKDQGKFPGLNGIEKVKYLGESSCEEQYRGIGELSGTSIKGIAFGISDLPKLARGLDGNQAAILYDPAASRLIKSGAFIRVPGLNYSLWISMFALVETLERFAIRSALLHAFVASWVFCEAHRNHAWKLLMDDKNIVQAFQSALFRRT